MSIEKLEIIDGGESTGLTFNAELEDHLYVICKWAKFLAILGFIFIGLTFIVMLIAGGSVATLLASSATGFGAAIAPVITIVILLLIALYILPVVYMYRFSSKIKQGLKFVNQESLNGGINNFRKFWKFVGVLTIAFLILNILTVIGSFATIASMQ